MRTRSAENENWTGRSRHTDGFPISDRICFVEMVDLLQHNALHHK